MSGLFHNLMGWVSNHTLWAGIIVFLVAFSESVAIFGLLVPGVVMMFGFGALIAAGALEFWPVFAWAVAGAVAGDGLSFWLGRHFQGQLRGFWPFSRHPQTLQRGVEFFEKYGGKSVAIGRFFGPVRAVIPLVAGMLGMRPWRFVVANLLSALLWAPAYLLPGVVFGASLELASEVAFRLVIILLLLLALLWLSFSLARRLFRLISPQASRLVRTLLLWGGRHPRLADIVNALGDPHHPEARGLGILASLLLLTSLLFGLLAIAVLQGSLFATPDQLVFNALQSIRNPWADSLMIQLSRLGDGLTVSLLALLVALQLYRQGRRKALQHWLAAIAFGLLAPPLLKYGLRIPRPYPVEGLGPWAFPSAHVLRATVAYGFLAILVARGLGASLRWLPYSLASALVASIALSRIYLGVHWLSDIIGSLLLGVAWISALGLAYHRHTRKPRHWLGISAVALLALAVSLPLDDLLGQTRRPPTYHPPPSVHTLGRAEWLAGRARPELPAFREDLRGHQDQPLNLQFAGDPQWLARRLAAAGWRPAERLDWHNLLRLLSPSLPLRDLPLLPQAHDGRHEALALVKPLSGKHRLVLRLWPTQARLEGDEQPLWLGNVSRQRRTILLGLLVYAQTEKEFDAPLQALTADLERQQIRLQRPRPGLLLLSQAQQPTDGQAPERQQKAHPSATPQARQ